MRISDWSSDVCSSDLKDTGGDIPKLQVAFPKAVETPCRDPGQIERGRSEAADARYFGRDRVQNALEPGHVAMAHEGNAGGDQGIGEVAPRRHAQATVLKPGALALFRPEAFVRQRLIDKSCDNRAARDRKSTRLNSSH